jgi:hypothetical protein
MTPSSRVDQSLESLGHNARVFVVLALLVDIEVLGQRQVIGPNVVTNFGFIVHDFFKDKRFEESHRDSFFPVPHQGPERDRGCADEY